MDTLIPAPPPPFAPADEQQGPPTPAAVPAPAAVSVDGAASWAAAIAREVSPSVAKVEVTTARGQGEGSAVIYSADGYLLTNNHVVEQAATVSVTLPNGRTYEARVVGSDPATDVAVIRIDATNLPVPAFAATAPAVGDEVLAIGTPFGLTGTVTQGIISALGRTVDTPNAPLANMLQTDAAVNPGNSGGALVDSQGQVVGINTAILSPSGTNNGIGFAIPITAARSTADQLIANGSVEHGYLGIAGQTVDARTASLYRLGVDRGAFVVQVEPGSPADDAGLRRGDIIMAVDGQAVAAMDDLSVALITHRPGDTVSLTVSRDGHELQLDAILGRAPSSSSSPGA